MPRAGQRFADSSPDCHLVQPSGLDEKSQIQAPDRSAPILPMLPGTPERAMIKVMDAASDRARSFVLYSAGVAALVLAVAALLSRSRGGRTTDPARTSDTTAPTFRAFAADPPTRGMKAPANSRIACVRPR
jgi:hypothetical protein